LINSLPPDSLVGFGEKSRGEKGNVCEGIRKGVGERGKKKIWIEWRGGERGVEGIESGKGGNEAGRSVHCRMAV